MGAGGLADGVCPARPGVRLRAPHPSLAAAALALGAKGPEAKLTGRDQPPFAPGLSDRDDPPPPGGGRGRA